MTLDQAIKAVLDDCKDPSAKAYAGAAMVASLEGGVEGLKTQVLYILNNTSGWRGEIAREAKKAMRAFVKAKR